jgi:UDP-2-acetamido-3-amino-2,3-dideoxy-glucuronate N-acetyltransferase
VERPPVTPRGHPGRPLTDPDRPEASAHGWSGATTRYIPRVLLDPSVQVHPAAICETASVGPRTRIWAFAHLLEGAVVGSDCNICDHVFIEGGARLGDRVTVKNASLIWDGVEIHDDVFVGPRVTFTNDLRPRIGHSLTPDQFVPTVVRSGASLGANVTVVCGVTIGEYALIGAGAVVVSDVAPHVLMLGVPARAAGWVCACGSAITAEQTCTCGRRYRSAPHGGLTPVEAS